MMCSQKVKLTLELFLWGSRSGGETKFSEGSIFFRNETRTLCGQLLNDQECNLGDEADQAH